MDTPTFVFDDDGKAYAYLNGKIVASADDADTLEQKLAGPFLPGQQDHFNPDAGSAGAYGNPPAGPGDPLGDGNDLTTCPTCGNTCNPGDQFCAACGSPLGEEGQPPPNEEPSAIGQADLPAASPDTLPGDNLPPRATHVETPNGLKGQILGKVKGLWGDQVTIRLENGRIAKFDVTDDLQYSSEKTASAPSPLAAIEARLEATPDGTKSSLLARVAELKAIKAEVSGLIRSRQVTANTAHELVVLADQELHEVGDALSALEDAEPYAPPAPFDPQVAEQESLGGNDSTWLDDTLGEMIAEAESTDFDQLMEEGPEVMVAEMETPALEDAQGVQDSAHNLVASKTAGLERDAVDDFRKAFLQRVEAARKAELETRNEQITQQREAATEDFDGPDEALFF